MKGWHRRVGASVVLGVVLSLAPVTSAFAYGRLDNPWGVGTSLAVGTCGVPSMNYVRSVQELMNAAHLYPTVSTSNVDGRWGPQTNSAITLYQILHFPASPLSWDGCVGYYTWSSLWQTNYFAFSDSDFGGADIYFWFYPNSPDYVASWWVYCPRGWYFYFTGNLGFWVEGGFNSLNTMPSCAPGP